MLLLIDGHIPVRCVKIGTGNYHGDRIRWRRGHYTQSTGFDALALKSGRDAQRDIARVPRAADGGRCFLLGGDHVKLIRRNPM